MKRIIDINEKIKQECENLNIEISEEVQDDIAQILFEDDEIWGKYYDMQKYLICSYAITGKVEKPQTELSMVDWDELEKELTK